MDTRRLGKNYPIFLQDMKYSYHRDASHVINLGYKSDNYSSLVIKTVSEPEFTTISEKMPDVNQFDKDVMKLSEITPTYNSYSVLFSDDPGAETIPRIEIETRSGMFEYLFMWVDYPPQTIVAFPKTHPIIQSLEFKVRGRENLFVRKLNGDDKSDSRATIVTSCVIGANGMSVGKACCYVLETLA